MSHRPAGRPNRRRSGQIIILTAIIITIVVLSLVSLVSQTVNLRQNLRYEPYKEVTEDLAASFRSAMAFALANMTEYYNATGDDIGGRVAALNYLSKWKQAAMQAYSDLGLQIDFRIPLNETSAYVLQGPRTISYHGSEEEIDPWELYNLTQLYWDQASACSASYATLYINLTEYGFYGWRKDIIVASNATLYPDSLTGNFGRSPGDVVLVLDASGSMLWQNLTSLEEPWDDQNDHLIHLSGTIGANSGWKTVGTFNVGEIPTQFAAVLDKNLASLEFRLVNGSYNIQLIITYHNATGDYTTILPVIADASVRSRYPNNNYGTNQSLEVSGYDPPGTYTDYYRVWLKFNITSIPSGATIDSAILTTYVQSQLSANGRTYYLHHSDTDTWIESGSGSIRWNNQPSYSSSHVDARAPSRGLMTWDVTTDVLNDYVGNKLSTWVIKDPSEGSTTKRYIVMYSKEAGGITGYNLLPSSSLPYHPGDDSDGARVVWSTNDGSQLDEYDWVFGRSATWFHGKNGTWSIQLRNTAASSRSYNIDVYARKLDEARNAATTFVKLLNPMLDRVALVQYGAGSSRDEGEYYYAATISSGSDGSVFYDLYDAVDLQKAILDINWRNPWGSPKDPIGYGFEYIPDINGELYAGGVTPLGAGLEVGNRLFNSTQGARDDSQRILIVITDGRENVNPVPPVPVPPGGPGDFHEPNTYSIDSQLPADAYAASNVTTYTIGFGIDVDGPALTQLAQQGQGEYYFAANGTQLAAILAKLAYGMNDKINFHFSLMQEYGAGINVLSGSDLTVFVTDPLTHERHMVDPSYFRYEGGGNFMVTASFAGSQIPEAVDIVVKDPRGILVRIHVPLAYWGA